MEILRLPPYPLTSTWDLPEANTDYILYVEDLVDHSIETTDITSDDNAKYDYVIPLAKVQYDRKFLIRFYDSDFEHILVESNLDILRPYVDPGMYTDTPTEYEEYKMLELVARSIIDSVVSDGFYNHKQIIQDTGHGTDYFPVWLDVNRVLKVWENNVLVYDYENESDYENKYLVTLDNSAILKYSADQIDRMEKAAPRLPLAIGDLGFYGRSGATFPKGFDYIFLIDTGYKAVPPDIEYATRLLIDDIKCGKLDYYKRYVTSYNTDDFQIKFADRQFDGTGNFVVDKILEKYANRITKLGIV
jgi:hypothetical protein